MLNGLPLVITIIAALLLIILACSVFRWHPFLVLLGTALALGLLTGLTPAQTLDTVLQVGGNVFSSIGIIIALGTILGTILEKTGAATVIAQGIIQISGRKNTLGSMSLLGAVTGIPVFCDSGFVILSNLGRSLSRQTGLSFGAISIALATGLYTTHVLIPPTPGPMAAAGNLGMADDLGWIILMGLLAAIPAMLTGYYFARKLARYPVTDPLPEETDIDTLHQPSFIKSIIPLLLPILLIGFGSMLKLLQLPASISSILLFLCNPNIALLISVVLAILLLALPFRQEVNSWITHALSQAGPIILITVAGGALGGILKATPLSAEFQQLMAGKTVSTVFLYPLAFALAAALKTAQGSSTAALVIASSIIAPIAAVLPALHPAQKALLVISIGGGSMTVSHANDSYFWVINQYSGIAVGKMYRYFTWSTLWMGISILITCMLLSLIF